MSTEKPKQLQDHIIDIVCAYFAVDPAEFIINKGRNITSEGAYRKHLCYYMLHKYTFLSFDAIGEIFNNRHSVIQYGAEKVNNLHSYHRRTIGDVQQIKLLIDNFIQESRVKNLSPPIWPSTLQNNIPL